MTIPLYRTLRAPFCISVLFKKHNFPKGPSLVSCSPAGNFTVCLIPLTIPTGLIHSLGGRVVQGPRCLGPVVLRAELSYTVEITHACLALNAACISWRSLLILPEPKQQGNHKTNKAVKQTNPLFPCCACQQGIKL